MLENTIAPTPGEDESQENETVESEFDIAELAEGDFTYDVSMITGRPDFPPTTRWKSVKAETLQQLLGDDMRLNFGDDAEQEMQVGKSPATTPQKAIGSSTPEEDSGKAFMYAVGFDAVENGGDYADEDTKIETAKKTPGMANDSDISDHKTHATGRVENLKYLLVAHTNGEESAKYDYYRLQKK